MTYFIPFTAEHIKAASYLLAERHTNERQSQPILPSDYENIDCAEKAIQAIFNKENTVGYVACDGNEMVGYMLGTLNEKDYLGDKAQGWVYLPGYAAKDESLYAELYARIADGWVKQGCYHHFTLVAASNLAVQDAWFNLSFGREQAHGALYFDKANIRPIEPDGVTIREANANDELYFRQMSQWISRYQIWTPTFAPVSLEYLNKQTDSFATLSTDEDATTFLAFKGDELVGYQVYYDVEADDSDMMHPRGATELVVAATKPNLKGQGIGRILTQHAFAEMQKRGYEICVADWRTANRASSNFWAKMGFVPTHYRLVRRLDERIGSIYQEVSL